MDLTGIDIGLPTKSARYAASDDPRDLPSRTRRPSGYADAATSAARPAAAATPTGLTTPRTDYYLLADLLDDDERAVRDRVRKFVDTEVLPIINDYWERAQFPFELVPKIAELGVVGGAIAGYGCPGLSRLAAGMVTLELSRGDGSVNTFLGVQNGLAMGSIEHARRRGAEAALAAGDGPAGEGRRVRAHRTRARLRFRRAWRPPPAATATTGCSTAPSGGSATATSPTSSSSGPGTSPTARSRASSWRSAAPDGDRLPRRVLRRADHREDRQARDLAARHHLDERAGAGGQQARRGQLLPRRDPGADRDPRRRVLGGARARRRRLRGRPRPTPGSGNSSASRSPATSWCRTSWPTCSPRSPPSS